jgi:hypothetical protein
MFLSSSRMRPADHAQIAMVSRIFLKDSGFVANAPSRQRTQWYVLTVRAVRTARCLAIQLTPQSCLFCPNEGGAFKQTTTGHWAHLLCAIWIPELGVGNAIYMEPVEGVEQIPKNRWKLVS